MSMTIAQSTASQSLMSLPNSQALAQAQAAVEPLDAAYARALKLIDRASRTRPEQALGRYLAAVWARYLAWHMRRTTRILLNSLDDRTLRDIGVRRSEIDAVLADIDRRRAQARF
jgi:uncharacterized protein YjiS (DUF1127 family)